VSGCGGMYRKREEITTHITFFLTEFLKSNLEITDEKYRFSTDSNLCSF